MIRLMMVVCVACVLAFSGCKLSLELASNLNSNTVKDLNANVSFYQEPTTKLCFMLNSAYNVSITEVPCDAALKSPKFVKAEQK